MQGPEEAVELCPICWPMWGKEPRSAARTKPKMPGFPWLPAGIASLPCGRQWRAGGQDCQSQAQE